MLWICIEWVVCVYVCVCVCTETAKDVIRIAGTGASDILRRHAPALAALIAAAKAQPAALPPTGADGPAAPGDTPAGSASAGVVGAASPVSLSALVPTSVPKIVRKGGLGAALKSHTTHTHTNTNTLSHTPNTTNTTHVNNTSHNSTVASDVATVATEAGSLRTSTGPHTTTTGAAADMRNGASDGVGETGGNGGVGEGSNGAMSPPLQVRLASHTHTHMHTANLSCQSTVSHACVVAHTRMHTHRLCRLLHAGTHVHTNTHAQRAAPHWFLCARASHEERGLSATCVLANHVCVRARACVCVCV